MRLLFTHRKKKKTEKRKMWTQDSVESKRTLCDRLDSAFSLFFFFCFHAFQGGRRQILLFMRQMSLFMQCSGTVHGTHIHFIQNKNGPHGTIHIFKNYFATVFSVFNFSNNKFNLNGSYKLDANAILSPFAHKKKCKSRYNLISETQLYNVRC